jgi:hypothetical protein
LPARSHARSVSTRTPRSFAASPIRYPSIGLPTVQRSLA